jgi:hypothetical protein
MMQRWQLILSFILTFCFIRTAVAQDGKPTELQKSTLTITAVAAGERVRFTAPSSVVQIRLEVYDSSGKKLFDNELRGGNVLDWHLQDGQAEPLADDTYLSVVTVKSLSGKIIQKIGSVTIEKNSASVQQVDPSQMTAQQSQAVGPVEENSSVTVLKGDDNQTTTVIAHNGEDGLITRGRGALSFRIGDFYSGKDIEQMRLTAEGNLGIGITHPLVKLDVDGLVRASQGIVFPDGSIQYSAATKTYGPKSSLPDPSFQNLQSKSGKKAGQEHIDAAGTGTLNFMAKWAETGGSGTLQDSSIFDDGFNIGIGTSSPGGVFDLQRSSASDILQRLWNTGSGGAKLRYVASVGATSQVQLTDLNEWLMSIAGNNQIGMQFRVRNTADPNTENGLAAAVRMTIARNGNVGIGTATPNGNLHVHGALGITTSGSGAAYFFRNRETNSDTGSADYWAWYSQGNVARFWRTGVGDLIGITTNGNVGIGTTSPTVARLVVNDTSIGTGVAGYTSTTGSGVYGQSTGSGGYGVYGINANGYGVYGTTSTITYAGVRGVSTAQSSYGVWGTANQPGGVGVQGEATQGFAMAALGNAYQQRDKGGWVKAMLYVNEDGTIARCYNGLTGSSTGTCGFNVSVGGATYYVDFGFQVIDRFWAVTPTPSACRNCDHVVMVGEPDTFPTNYKNILIILGRNLADDSETGGPFCIIIF